MEMLRGKNFSREEKTHRPNDGIKIYAVKYGTWYTAYQLECRMNFPLYFSFLIGFLHANSGSATSQESNKNTRLSFFKYLQ